jgi:hypothetical protein
MNNSTSINQFINKLHNKSSLKPVLPMSETSSVHNIASFFANSRANFPISTLWLGGVLLVIGIIIWIITSYCIKKDKNE